MSIVLPTKKVAAERVNPKRLIIYSKPKTGKTTAFAGLENNLLIDLKHSLKNGEFVDGNALLVDEVRTGDWSKYMKKLINNPNFAYDLGQKLYETVKDTYDLNVVTKNRAELYKSLVK